jgi:hypothetical protein
MLFGVTWAIDAVLKWLPGYRHTFLSQLKGAAQRQPSWLHWWFHGWISVQSHAPSLFAGPYGSGSTDVGTGIILAILFAALYVTAPSAGSERLSLDRKLVKRWAWWRLLAEPHAADRR